MIAPKVLLVEDEKALAQIIGDTMEMRGFEVFHIADGASAYEAYLSRRPDVIVLDVMLPGESGLHIAAKIREEDRSVPILFLTAKSTTDDLIQGFKAGGNDYMKKPFDLEELVIRLDVLLNRNRLYETESLPETVAIGSYQYDLKRHTLVHATKKIQLSARESEVLTMLFQYRSKLLTRKALLLRVWSNDDFFSSRSLDVYISKLRRHLRDDAGVKIVNYRGFGYRLVC